MIRCHNISIMKKTQLVLFYFSIIIFSMSFTSKIEKVKKSKSTTAQLNIVFKNIVNNSEVELNSGKYTNASGEAFTVSLLQYFISNIVLTKKDGTTYIVPQDSSYFLVKEADAASKTIHLNVPEGSYEKLSFILGIDSLRNTQPLSKRTGVLDPASYVGAENMYWSWNSGYIFFKMEGNKINLSDTSNTGKKFRYHIGLFGGMDKPTLNNIKFIELDLKGKGIAKVKSGKTASIECSADVAKMFTGSSTITIEKYGTVMAGPTSALIANNYQHMFTHSGTK